MSTTTALILLVVGSIALIALEAAWRLIISPLLLG